MGGRLRRVMGNRPVDVFAISSANSPQQRKLSSMSAVKKEVRRFPLSLPWIPHSTFPCPSVYSVDNLPPSLSSPSASQRLTLKNENDSPPLRVLRASVVNPPKATMLTRLRLSEMIRFSHTLFALPFLLLAGRLELAGVECVSIRHAISLARAGRHRLLHGVAARGAAMAFNRLADWKLDAGIRTQSAAYSGRVAAMGFRGDVLRGLRVGLC